MPRKMEAVGTQGSADQARATVESPNTAIAPEIRPQTAHSRILDRSRGKIGSFERIELSSML